MPWQQCSRRRVVMHGNRHWHWTLGIMPIVRQVILAFARSTFADEVSFCGNRRRKWSANNIIFNVRPVSLLVICLARFGRKAAVYSHSKESVGQTLWLFAFGRVRWFYVTFSHVCEIQQQISYLLKFENSFLSHVDCLSEVCAVDRWVYGV